MELVLTRIAKRKGYTIGRLYIVERVDDEYLAGEKQTYFCDTLEPTALELKTKVSKEAVLRSPTKAASLKPFAIPEGRYPIVITFSPTFKKWLPLLVNVPMFSGIRIHAGNDAVNDSQGCILVGENRVKGKVLNSRKYVKLVKAKIVEAKDKGESVFIEIR